VNKNNFHHITDQELLDNFYKTLDNDWLGILLQRYILLLFGVCLKYLKNEEEAKDAVQQIVLKAIMELHKYKITYFSSWIYTVTRNHCLMKLRERPERVSLTGLESKIAVEEETLSQKDYVAKENLIEMMTNSLSQLSPEQKDCVTLFYLERKSYQQIAEQTGFSLMQVKSHIQNGKRNLKIVLDKKMKKQL
jgi:RNA polymerase sigma factor (sigma-70 family)